MKRLLPLFLALAFCFGLTGCLSAEEQQDRKLALELVNGTSSATYALSTGTALEGQPIYEDNSGLIVYLAGITGTPRAPQLVLAVKNGTRHDLSLSVDNLIYDNWAADGWIDSYTIHSHSAAMTTISCDRSFGMLNLSDLHTVSFDLRIYDDHSYDTLATVHVDQFFGDPDWADETTLTGRPLLDSHDVQIAADSLQMKEDRAALDLTVFNQSDRMIRVTSTNVTLNGTPVEMLFWSSVSPHSRRRISESILEEDSYKSIPLAPEDELAFRLQIVEDEYLSTLAEVDVVLHGTDFTAAPSADTPEDAADPAGSAAAAPSEADAAA